MKHEEIQKIAKLAKFVCERLDAEKLLPLIQFQQSQATSFGGMATYKNGEYILKISIPVWEVSNEQQKKTRIIHEVCHLVNYWRNEFVSHGWKWVILMRKCGITNPSRFGKTEKPLIPKNSIPFRCGCSELVYMGKTQYRRFLNGKKYYCSDCKKDAIPVDVSPRILEK